MEDEHSPLGGSGAKRWVNCHGSVALIDKLKEQHRIEGVVEEEEDWTREGQAGHKAAEKILVEELELFELIGETVHDTLLTPELIDPLHEYVTYCRQLMQATNTWGVEYKISSPVHPLFFGRIDFWALAPGYQTSGNALHIVDLKMGIGVSVEVEDNWQELYYAFGVIDTLERTRNYVFDDDMEVVLTIAQPRGFHPDGPLRCWSTSVGYIKGWIHNFLVPHMLATAYDNTLDAGEHCRFCPAKLVCPMLTALFKAACLASPDIAPDFTDAQLGFNYKYAEPVKFFVKAIGKEAQRRLEAGRTIPVAEGQNLKLVHQKTNRVWKPGAAELAIRKFGRSALAEPLDKWLPETLLATPSLLVDHIKSPAQLEKVPLAASWVKEFAFQPKGALTVAFPDNRQPAIDVKRLSERYEGVTDAEV